MKKNFLIILVLILIQYHNAAFANDNENQTKNESIQFNYGIYTGWKSPYGTSCEISLLSKNRIDFNIGAGISMCGFKIGAGTRVYLLKNTKVSPLLGAYFFHSSGVNPLRVIVNDVEAIYKINPNNAVVLNTGLRFNIREKYKLITCIGYSLPFNNEEAIYLSGSTSSEVNSFVNRLTAGGISFSMGLLWHF